MSASFIHSALPCRPSRRHRPAPNCSAKRPQTPSTFSVCTGPTCSQSSFGKSLYSTLSSLATTTTPPSQVERVGCLGECGRGPNVGVSQTGLTPSVHTGVSSAAAATALLEGLGLCPSAGLVSALARKESADALFLKGQAEHAAAEYAAVAQELKGWPELVGAVRANRAGALMEIGRVEEALQEANRAVDVAPGSVAGWKRKMNAHEKKGERESAVAAGKVLVRLLGGKEREKVEKRLRSLETRWFWQR